MLGFVLEGNLFPATFSTETAKVFLRSLSSITMLGFNTKLWNILRLCRFGFEMPGFKIF